MKDTPLLLASRKEHVSFSKTTQILKPGAFLAAIHWGGAIYRDYIEVARLLTEYGADVKAQDRNENTSLFWALEWGKPAAAQALIEHGADVKVLDKDKKNLLHRVKGEENARLLLEQGADADAPR